MISGHIVAVSELHHAIETLRESLKLLPDGREKYRLEAELHLMERTAQEYTNNSLRLYDQMFKFAMVAAS